MRSGALAHGTTSLVISRMAVGLGTAAVVPVANSILGQLYDGPKKASRMAIFNLGLLFGGALGFFAGKSFGFPAVVIWLAIPGALVALVITMLDDPGASRACPIRGSRCRKDSAGSGDSARMLLRIPTLRWMMLSTTTMAFAAGGYNAWLIDFLERDKGMTPTAATNLLSAALVGAVLGVVAGGRIADYLRSKIRDRPAVDDRARHDARAAVHRGVPRDRAGAGALRRGHRELCSSCSGTTHRSR